MKVGAAMPTVELNVAAPRVEVEAEGGLMGKLFGGGKHKHHGEAKVGLNVAAPTLDVNVIRPQSAAEWASPATRTLNKIARELFGRRWPDELLGARMRGRSQLPSRHYFCATVLSADSLLL